MEEEFKNSEKERLTALVKQVQQKNDELELHRKKIEKQNAKSRQRTIELFGKMIDLKKAKKIISIQNEELEKKNEEINKKRAALENTYVKFRKRTIELFGKMVDLRKAYNIINNQKQEIEKQRQQLHELNASKDKFFSIVAHDLKNPIAGFLGLTEVMAQDMNSFSDAEKQEFIELIHKSSKQLHSLLENLLQWSRAQTGRLSYKPQKLHMASIVSDNYALVRANAEVKQIDIDVDVPDEAYVWADADMVNTILRNLLTNAVKFSHKNGHIKVLAKFGNDTLYTSVQDDGVGIKDEDKEKLFKIGHNTSTVGTNNEEGTGLGLILCKEFAKRNKGDVTVESEPDKGSTFTVSLPLAKATNSQ